jgi:hypothetical protein
MLIPLGGGKKGWAVVAGSIVLAVKNFCGGKKQNFFGAFFKRALG